MDLPKEIQQNIKAAIEAYRNGQYLVAADMYRGVAQYFSDQQEPLMAVEMLNNCSVALLKAGHSAAAWEAANGTDAVFAQAGDLNRQALAIGNQAAAKEALGDLPGALALYKKSAELLYQTGDRDTRAIVLRSISVLQMRMGNPLPALASMDTALSQKKQLSFREKILHALLKTPFKMLGK